MKFKCDDHSLLWFFQCCLFCPHLKNNLRWGQQIEFSLPFRKFGLTPPHIQYILYHIFEKKSTVEEKSEPCRASCSDMWIKHIWFTHFWTHFFREDTEKHCSFKSPVTKPSQVALRGTILSSSCILSGACLPWPWGACPECYILFIWPDVSNTVN